MTISNFRPEKALCSIFALLLCSHSATLSAETRYVTDELQLSMYEEINSQGKLLQRLNSGTELELLESKGLYAKVRTQEGVEGWTKAGFLISEKPARAQLTDAQERIDDLEGKLDQSQQQLTATQTDLKKIQNNQGEAYAQLTKRLESAEKIAATVDRVKQENETYRARLNSDEGRIPLKWGLIGAAISLFMGIVGGIALFDYRSRRRHGGYRIY